MKYKNNIEAFIFKHNYFSLKINFGKIKAIKLLHLQKEGKK